MPGEFLLQNAVEDHRLTMSSIRQNPYADRLPDFRNLGVMARVLIGVNVAALLVALVGTPSVEQGLERFVQSATVIEPLALASLVALYVVSAPLARLPYWVGCAAVLGVALGLAFVLNVALTRAQAESATSLLRTLAVSAFAVVVLLGYFRLRARAYSPALTEARLQILQARIRPHFLFNSLNAVLSLIRRDPKRAERSLEDLADLFRTLMSDPRQYVSLAEEISLLERYACLEQLRLGERLRITWEIDSAPSDALLPPLVLQPLLENAVYHGVEPALGPSDVLVHIERRGDRVLARIENPFVEGERQRSGNRMALENIRERLALFFDAEASIDTDSSGGRYRVQIEMPYRVSPA
jgi:two-component system sensor histidine kinase AlgZ